MSTSRLIINAEGESEWIEIGHAARFTPQKTHAQGEDLTVDGYIRKHGGIYSHCDKQVYTSKGAYMDHLKANNKVILDFK